jgi:hypothetical protein
MKNIYRHGDLSFHQIDKLPEDLKEVEQNGSFVLALGEHTGHKHVITVPRKKMRIFQDFEGKYILEIKEEASISHEEHSTIILIPGLYEMRNEREFDYFANATIRVVD